MALPPPPPPPSKLPPPPPTPPKPTAHSSACKEMPKLKNRYQRLECCDPQYTWSIDRKKCCIIACSRRKWWIVAWFRRKWLFVASSRCTQWWGDICRDAGTSPQSRRCWWFSVVSVRTVPSPAEPSISGDADAFFAKARLRNNGAASISCTGQLSQFSDEVRCPEASGEFTAVEVRGRSRQPLQVPKSVDAASSELRVETRAVSSSTRHSPFTLYAKLLLSMVSTCFS